VPRGSPRLGHVAPLQPTTSCHVSAVDWPTCQSRTATSIIVLSRHSATSIVILSRQPATSPADVTHATCHPYSGDTCHLGIGPTVRLYAQICLPHVITRGCHVTCTDLPRQCMDMSRQRPYGLYGLHSRQKKISCLTFRTECDIFSIRIPFDKVNIPPESGRRDGRNGIGFVAFRSLSFLSIFQALSGFWIRFRITPPHNKTFWSPKGY
jgi:hypothetical protein